MDTEKVDIVIGDFLSTIEVAYSPVLLVKGSSMVRGGNWVYGVKSNGGNRYISHLREKFISMCDNLS